jgi:hypothetical protein
LIRDVKGRKTMNAVPTMRISSLGATSALQRYAAPGLFPPPARSVPEAVRRGPHTLPAPFPLRLYPQYGPNATTPIFWLCSRPLRAPRARRSAVLVRAAGVPLPKGATLPPASPVVPPPMFGFVDFAEKMNSRACMIGFFALLAVEAISGTGLLNLMGIATGKGLGFEF